MIIYDFFSGTGSSTKAFEDASQYLAFMRLGDLMTILQQHTQNNEPTRCKQCGGWMIENALCHTCQIGGINAKI